MVLKAERIKRIITMAVSLIYIIAATYAVTYPIIRIQKQKTMTVAVAVPQEDTFYEKSDEWLSAYDTELFVPEQVYLNCTTVKKDITIELRSSATNDYVTGVDFKATVTDSSGKATEYTCTDGSGYIYVSPVSAGTYSVNLESLPGGFYSFSSSCSITVKAVSSYKAITTPIKVVDTPKEENKVATVTVLKNTVDYVASSKKVTAAVTKYEVISIDEIAVPLESAAETDALLDKSGNPVYIERVNEETGSKEYAAAEVSDYDNSGETAYYTQKITPGYTTYYGWQTLNGYTYYYDKNGKAVTGYQVIQGVPYNFNSNGTLAKTSGSLGMDVSYYQGTINWTKAKAAGIKFVIVRIGFRGYGTTGSINLDKQAVSYIKGASAAGIKVGIYFFTQAVTKAEAVEEASFCIQTIDTYGLKSMISYPIFIDSEYANSSHSGRADSLNRSVRTACVIAFCETIVNSGYKAGVYASKSWFNNQLYAGQLNSYYIWLAHWVTKTDYTGKYDMWQYGGGTGSTYGVSSSTVDLNLSYLVF